MSRTANLNPAGLAVSDLARVATVGVRTRRMRAALSALGITIGVGAIVAVLGLSSSSQAGLLAEIDRLGTNLLTVTNGTTFTGQPAQLPLSAPSMIARIAPVQMVADIGTVPNATAYRTPLVPSINTNALQVQATSLNLPGVIATNLASGSFLNPATASKPVAVLGASAAQRLGIDRVYHRWRGPAESVPRSRSARSPASCPRSGPLASHPPRRCAPGELETDCRGRRNR